MKVFILNISYLSKENEFNMNTNQNDQHIIINHLKKAKYPDHNNKSQYPYDHLIKPEQKKKYRERK